MKKMKNNSRITWLAVALVTVFMIAFTAVVVTASEPQAETLGVSQFNECLGMDIIFLIDQSSSMGGEGKRAEAIPHSNDPLQLRIEASNFVVNWLVNNKLGLCKDVIHQIAILSFGEEVVQDLPPSIIDPGDFSQAEVLQSELASKIVPHNLGTTDHALAFESAAELFDDFSSIGGGPRKRVIVMLTDGQPYLDRDDFVLEPYLKKLNDQIDADFPFAEELKEREDAFEKILDAHNGDFTKISPEEFNLIAQNYPPEDLEDAYENSTYIWITAINDDSNYLRSVGTVFKDIAKSRGGDLINLGKSINDISLQYNLILSRLGFVPVELLGCGPVPMEPYLSGSIMNIFAVGEEIKVKIMHEDPSLGGQIFVLDGGEGTDADKEHFGLLDYQDFGSTENYYFRNPPGGIWEIEATNCDVVKLSYTPFDALVTFDENAELPQCPSCGHPADRPDVKLQIGVEEQASTPSNPLYLKEDSNYPLKAIGEFTDPNGNYAGTVSFSLDPSKDGILISDDAVPARIDGTYSFDLKATSICIDPDNYESEECAQPGDTFTIFEQTGYTYKVYAVDEVVLDVIEPTEGDKYPVHALNGFLPPTAATPPVRIQFTDASGEGVPISQVLDTTASPYFDSAKLVFGTEEYALDFKEEGDALVATISNAADPDFLLQPGEYVFHLEPGQSLVKALQYTSFGIADAQLMSQDIRFQIADTYQTAPWFYWLKVAIAGLILLAVLILILYMLGSPIRGSLEFFVGDSLTPHRVSIKTALRSKTVKKGIPPAAGVAKVKIVNAESRGGRQQISADFHMNQGKVVTHALDAGGNPRGLGGGVKVGYQWAGKVIGGRGGGRKGPPKQTGRTRATPRVGGRSQRGRSSSKTSGRKSRGRGLKR